MISCFKNDSIYIDILMFFLQVDMTAQNVLKHPKYLIQTATSGFHCQT